MADHGMTRHEVRTALGVGAAVVAASCFLLLGSSAVASAEADVPDWFEANRVQAHCVRYRLKDDSGGLDLHKPLADIGARAVTLLLDTSGEGAWWPSAVGETHEFARQRDLAREIIESVHSNGMKCIGYYRYMSDGWAQQEHPEWLCRDTAGRPVPDPRGSKGRREPRYDVLCVNSSYRDFVQTRLCELARRGIDMFYFDSWHMPEVCTCASCQNRFEAVTGKPFPLRVASGTTPTEPKGGGANAIEDGEGQVPLAGDRSAEYLEVSRFVSRSLQETFTQWRAAVTKINPHVRFAIGSSGYPSFLSQPQLTADFLAIADSSKTEFKKQFGGNARQHRSAAELPGFSPPSFDIQTALGWSLVRDSCDGRPPLMWIPRVKSERDALRASAAAYSYGCVASMAIEDISGAKALFGSTFANGAKVSSALDKVRPYGWAAIHISERARNRRMNDEAGLWKDVIAPAIGAFESMVRAHLPVVTINDRQLANGLPDETRVLILASPDEVTEGQSAAIARWRQKGGVVLRLATGQDWYTAAGRTTRMSALLADVSAAAGRPPVQVSGPATMHAAYYRHPQDERFVVALTNAWDNYEDPEGAAPPPCTGVTIELDPALFPAATATEMLTGERLAMTRTENTTAAKVPSFEINRCVQFTR
ncbi:MAG: hypothetical protein FJX74_18385 [Armatimonadetes bacterium]|nr:hypothetical protein [Armatimonadota bacterium]